MRFSILQLMYKISKQTNKHMTLQPNVMTMIKFHSLHTMHFHIPSANNLTFECKIPCTTQRANIKVTTQHIHIHIFDHAQINNNDINSKQLTCILLVT